MSKQFFLICILFVVCVVGSYYFFKPNARSHTDLALAYIKENNFVAAEEALHSFSSQPNAFPLALYKSYLEQARGHFLESHLYLNRLLKESQQKWQGEALVEIYLAQAANAFFEQHDQEMDMLIDSACQVAPRHSFVTFFQGLTHYLHANYAEALKSWKTFNPKEITEGTDWMPTIVGNLFPTSWRQLHVAHCLTETGDILAGREILEKECHHMDDQHFMSLATLFLGLTYLKEAEHIPLDQRGSYYKLARFYFERTGIQELFQRERRLITMHVQQEAEALLLANADEEKQKWGFDFVHTLLEWKSNNAVETVASQLVHKLLQPREERNVQLCRSIRQEFLGSPFHVLLTQKLLDAMAHGLKQGDTENLYEIWAMVETLSPTPMLLAKQIASMTSEEIFRTIKRDNASLVHTRRYVAFWEKLDRNAQEREKLAHDLFLHAKLFWQQEHQEKKGEQLMDLALKLCGNTRAMEQQIGDFLTHLFALAENSNLIHRLTMIFDAMERFHINKQELATPGKLANHLADADYLYHACHYALAKTHALWVLKLDPENAQAQRLVGLSSFHLREYTQALYALKKLDNPDEDARKALMLSQVFASQEQEKHLAQIDNPDVYEEE